jgi:D-3-phosphoglycerate dehydrogenase
VYKILVNDTLTDAGLALLREAEDVQVDADRLSPDQLLERIGGYHALIVRSGTQVTRAVIERGANLKVIGRAGTGVDNIDLEAATQHGIMVMNAPQANSIATAEHTVAMMLALCRHIPAASASLHRGEWQRKRFMGAQLWHKTLGILGFGRIGRLVAARARAFGMTVLAYDPYIDENVASQLDVRVAAFDELLQQSDFISLHTTLTPETEGLLGAEDFARMKGGVRIVNCARGGLIDEAALLAALQSGKAAGAALDVFSTEPPPADDPLLNHPGVVAVPHLGANTIEAQRDVSMQIVQQVLHALRGTDYRNVLNLPFIVGPEYSRSQPYLELAEKIGLLQSQMAGGRIRSVEVETKGDSMSEFVKPITVALLKGLLESLLTEHVNYINAPLLAAERGVAVSQTHGMDLPDYPNLLSCRVRWDGGERIVAGALFGGVLGRLVQVDSFHMDVLLQGNVLVMLSRDVPGVIGRVGTIMAEHDMNIADWRLGRDEPGGTALSFVNLDQPLTDAALEALKSVPEISEAWVLWFDYPRPPGEI